MTVHFSSPEIKNLLLAQLAAAADSVEIAMAWFTDRDLFAALQEAARRGARVCLLLHDDDINRQSRNDWDALAASGAAVYWHTPEQGTMHHKFCVIDKRHCLYGSYNWTFAAANFNAESLIHIENEDTARSFREELQKLLADPRTHPHDPARTHVFSQEIAAHPGLAQMKAEITLLELEITALKTACAECERTVGQHTHRIHAELAELLLQQIDCQRLLAEAKAKQTPKKIYQEEAKRWQEHAQQTRENIAQARATEPPNLADDDLQTMQQMYRETLFKIHPDHFENDAAKRELATQLTQSLIEAFKRSDFSTVREIWETVQQGWAFVSDILQSDSWAAVTAYLEKLKTQRRALEAQLAAWNLHEIICALKTYPRFEDYIEICRAQLLKNIEQLQREIANIPT